jgi:hypothetical protein
MPSIIIFILFYFSVTDPDQKSSEQAIRANFSTTKIASTLIQMGRFIMLATL